MFSPNARALNRRSTSSRPAAAMRRGARRIAEKREEMIGEGLVVLVRREQSDRSLVISSGMPFTAVATTGSCIAIASRMTSGSPSKCVLSTKTSNAPITRATSVRKPVKMNACATPSRSSSRCTSAKCSRCAACRSWSPTITNRASGTTSSTRFAARASVM